MLSDGCLLMNGPILVTFAVECSESCNYSKDGYCDDGGSGSYYDVCLFGTDCEVGLPYKNDLSNN